MRTLMTKERLCCDTIDNDAILKLHRKRVGRKRGILVAAVEVAAEAQAAMLNIQPDKMSPDWSASRTPTALVVRYRRRNGRHSPRI